MSISDGPISSAPISAPLMVRVISQCRARYGDRIEAQLISGYGNGPVISQCFTRYGHRVTSQYTAYYSMGPVVRSQCAARYALGTTIRSQCTIRYSMPDTDKIRSQCRAFYSMQDPPTITPGSGVSLYSKGVRVA